MKTSTLYRLLSIVAIGLSLGGCASSSSGGYANGSSYQSSCVQSSHTSGTACAQTQVRASR